VICCRVLQTRGDLPGKIMGMPEVGRVSGKYGVFNDQPPSEAALVGLGGRQHAVFGLDQLRELGHREGDPEACRLGPAAPHLCGGNDGRDG
jgi:hypothetical protein